MVRVVETRGGTRGLWWRASAPLGNTLVPDEIHANRLQRSRTIPLASLATESRTNGDPPRPEQDFNNRGELQTSLAIIPDPDLRSTFAGTPGESALRGCNLFGMLALEIA